MFTEPRESQKVLNDKFKKENEVKKIACLQSEMR